VIKTLLSIFWSSEQRRLRTFWRLSLQIGVWLTLQVVSVVPVVIIAIIAFSIPPLDIERYVTESEPFRLVLTAISLVATLITVWLAGRFLDRRRFIDFGLHLDRNWWIDFCFGLALGALLMGFIFLTEWAAGWITPAGFLQSVSSGLPFIPGILASLIAYVCVGIYEEFQSRGYHLKNLAEGLGFIKPKGAVLVATLVSSVIFGIMHAYNPNASAISTFNLFLAGLFLALGYILTGELAIPIGLHITWNFFQGNVFGFPVSGTEAGATFIAIQQGGSDLITGGAFGPEGGLIGIAAMILGSILMVLWVRVRYGQVAILEKLVKADLRHRREEATNGEQQIASTTESSAARLEPS
jgi:membrane protease YdiL (CAAX protease family)